MSSHICSKSTNSTREREGNRIDDGALTELTLMFSKAYMAKSNAY